MTVQSSEGSNDSHPAETEKSFDALECSVVDCEGSLNPIQTVCQRETKVHGKPRYGSFGVISFPKNENQFSNPPAQMVTRAGAVFHETPESHTP
jgi:hypothetical protein